MRCVLFVVMFFAGQLVKAQDLTGIWRGSFSSADNVMEMLNLTDRYKLEVQLDQQKKSFTGVTYSYKTTVFYGKASASGTINTANGKIKLMELAMLELKMQQNSVACIMTYTLQYSKNGDEEFLEGTYTSFNEKDTSSCGKGTVYLRRVHTSDFYIEPFIVNREKEKRKKRLEAEAPAIAKSTPAKPNAGAGTKPAVTPKTGSPTSKTPAPKTSTARVPATAKPLTENVTPKPKTAAPPPLVTKKPVPKTTPPLAANKTPPPAVVPDKPVPNIARVDTSRSEMPAIKKAVVVPRVLASRENELVKTISVNSNRVTINIYDNGTIDHDTVSVYLDKKLVLSKKMLTTTPLTLSFDIDEVDDVHELIMVAENLGDFPPNTSLMVVKAGDQQHEVRITSTEQKNAVVMFRYEKPK